MVDSQSFPLQVPGFLELSQQGAYSSSSVYSPSDVKDIVAYAGAVCEVCLFSRFVISNVIDIAWN